MQFDTWLRYLLTTPLSGTRPYASLLHVVAHLLAGPAGVSRRYGQYHNARFRDAASGLGDGYAVAYDNNHGWCVPLLTDEHERSAGHLLLMAVAAHQK